jgi:hypothetical protein
MLLVVNVLVWKQVFNRAILVMFFSKAYQYDSIDEKICKNLKYFFVKFAQIDLQKCITWPKISRKGRQEWEKARVESSLCLRKLNTPMKTRY